MAAGSVIVRALDSQTSSEIQLLTITMSCNDRGQVVQIHVPASLLITVIG